MIHGRSRTRERCRRSIDRRRRRLRSTRLAPITLRGPRPAGRRPGGDRRGTPTAPPGFRVGRMHRPGEPIRLPGCLTAWSGISRCSAAARPDWPRRSPRLVSGARTIVLERAEYPRYKTCGGGLIGASLDVLRPLIKPPARDAVRIGVFTLHGGREIVHRGADDSLIEMVTGRKWTTPSKWRRRMPVSLVRQAALARSIEQDGESGVRSGWPTVRSIRRRIAIGADGSGGISARHVGVTFDQVDLGLEVEIPVAARWPDHWRGRVLLDWGRIPGSYGWVFPKSDRLTVGVIAARGHGAQTRAYLDEFVARLGLDGMRAAARLRSPHPMPGSRLAASQRPDDGRRRRRLVCWSRGPVRASASRCDPARSPVPPPPRRRPPRTRIGWTATSLRSTGSWLPEMAAGRRLMTAFRRHPGAFHSSSGAARLAHVPAAVPQRDHVRRCRESIPGAPDRWRS